MKQYSGWQALYLSFYSREFYREVGESWKGVGYFYLFSLSCLVSLILAIQFQLTAVPKIQQCFEKIIDPMPKIQIENGHLSIDKPCPYIVTLDKQTFGYSASASKLESSEPLAIIFDTRAQPVDIKQRKDAILVTSSTIRIYTTSRSLKKDDSIDLVNIDHFDIDRNSAKQMFNSLLKWFSPVVFLLVLIASFAIYAIQTLIYGFVIKLLDGGQLSYNMIVKLASVALTPAILLNLILKLMSVDIPFQGLFSIVIALGYVDLAVNANKTNA